MLCYKLYPTRDEYQQVALQITDKYKWMSAKIGPLIVTVCALYYSIGGVLKVTKFHVSDLANLCITIHVSTFHT